ncbi:MAG: hypothetical protein ACFBZ9_14565 [Sphingomonadales bacterium]
MKLWLSLFVLSALALPVFSATVVAQDDQSGIQPSLVTVPIPEPEQTDKTGVTRAAIRQTLASLIATETKLREELVILRRQLPNAEDEIARADIEEEIITKRAELDQVSKRIEELATGIEASDYNLTSDQEFDLQTELQQLIEPFVSIMKSATEEARNIERLRRIEQNARAQKAVADRAVDGIETLIEDATEPVSKARLATLLKIWREKAQAAGDLAVSTERQLELKLSEQEDVTESSGAAIREFLSTRGRNLLYGFIAFGVVFVGLRLVGRGIGATQRKGTRRSFGRRLFQLVFAVLTVILAYVAMLSVFNSLNDWLLFGLGILLLLAVIWLVLKTLPSLIEQTTLLLNLGAVQEGERIMFNGVPFLVEKLDFYTNLSNPKLRGGHFTIPVSELSGFHSRPVAKDEVWFPTEEGDVVILEDERWGRIVFQSPEAVVMQDDGGSDITFETPAFLGLTPRNMSHGYRTESEFGVDYKHQAIATTDIPRIMAEDVRKDIERTFGAEKVRNVAVEFIRAGDSALIYEVEADMTGAAAWQWEEVMFALAKFATDSCTRNGWNIPFPHLSIHKLN